jgi:hypothetical protein
MDKIEELLKLIDKEIKYSEAACLYYENIKPEYHIYNRRKLILLRLKGKIKEMRGVNEEI